MTIILNSLKERKYLIQGIIFFSFFIVIFFILDYLNMSYSKMISSYGIYLVIINILLNIILAVLSTILLISSDLIVRKSKASSLSYFAILFGMLTYGCTTCVIAFLANFGIIFTVMVLPLAGLPYKLISLALIVIGFFITIRQIKKGCKIVSQND